MNLSKNSPSIRVNLLEVSGLDIDFKKLRRAANSRRWAAANRPMARAYASAWASKNKDKVTAYRIRRMCDPRARVLSILTQAKQRASRSGLAFGITIKDLAPLPTVCPVLGIALNYSGTGGRKGFVNNSPSIDRINPAIGYVAGNVQIISWRANRLKSDATIDEITAILGYMVSRCS